MKLAVIFVFSILILGSHAVANGLPIWSPYPYPGQTGSPSDFLDSLQSPRKIILNFPFVITEFTNKSASKKDMYTSVRMDISIEEFQSQNQVIYKMTPQFFRYKETSSIAITSVSVGYFNILEAMQAAFKKKYNRTWDKEIDAYAIHLNYAGANYTVFQNEEEPSMYKLGDSSIFHNLIEVSPGKTKQLSVKSESPYWDNRLIILSTWSEEDWNNPPTTKSFERVKITGPCLIHQVQNLGDVEYGTVRKTLFEIGSNLRYHLENTTPTVECKIELTDPTNGAVTTIEYTDTNSRQ